MVKVYIQCREFDCSNLLSRLQLQEDYYGNRYFAMSGYKSEQAITKEQLVEYLPEGSVIVEDNTTNPKQFFIWDKTFMCDLTDRNIIATGGPNDFLPMIERIHEDTPFPRPVQFVFYNEYGSGTYFVPGVDYVFLGVKHYNSNRKRDAGVLAFKYNDYEHTVEFKESWGATAFVEWTKPKQILNMRGLKAYQDKDTNAVFLFYAHNLKGSSLTTMLKEKDFWKKWIIPFLTNLDKGKMEEIDTSDMALIMFQKHWRQGALDEITVLERKVSQYRTAIESDIKKISNNKIQLDSFVKELDIKQRMMDNDNGKDIIAKQFADIKALDWVTDLQIVNTDLVITTTPISIFGMLELGPYKIALNPKNDKIEIKNTKNSVEGGYWQHPHVKGGLPCWGNYTDVYYHLKKLDFYTTLIFVYEFLSTINPDDEWGKNIFMWDVKKGVEIFKAMGFETRIPYYRMNEYKAILAQEKGKEAANGAVQF